MTDSHTTTSQKITDALNEVLAVASGEAEAARVVTQQYPIAIEMEVSVPGVLHECFLMHRPGDPEMFSFLKEETRVHLDRYAVVPLEEWNRLRKLAGEKETGI